MEDKPNIIMLPPVAAIGALGICFVLQFAFDPNILSAFPDPSLMKLGGILIVIGFLTAGLGVAAFHGANTNVDPTKPALTIVNTGPYRFTRNPMYIGLVLVHFGLGLAFSLDWTILLTPGLGLLLHFGVVLREEAYLTAKFGDQYRDLLQSTRRWI